MANSTKTVRVRCEGVYTCPNYLDITLYQDTDKVDINRILGYAIASGWATNNKDQIFCKGHSWKVRDLDVKRDDAGLDELKVS